MGLLYAATLFLSALLLFLVQPMAGKMLLPKLGGTPAVWNTCMVFFQAMLLAGYGYAHVLSTRLSLRRQVAVHLAMLMLPLLLMPIRLAEGVTPPPDANPIPWLLGNLFISLGLPFFVLSASAPLFQKWFSLAGGSSGRDPYYLYAASNAGSMLALIAYPTVVEPYLPLKATQFLSQSWMWGFAYGIWILLVAACGWDVLHIKPSPILVPDSVSDDMVERAPSGRRQLKWIALAFVPSSLMLAVTTYLTLDIAALPLLWVIPLALYLLSFILVFARWPQFLHMGMILAVPVLVLLLVFTNTSGIKPPIGGAIALHLLGFFAIAMVCHGELARTRPPTRYLTQFYFLMSLGGVLGGIFNALVAPLVFDGIAEYPIALILACLLLPPLGSNKSWLAGRLFPRWTRAGGFIIDVAAALLLGIGAYGAMSFWYASSPDQQWLASIQDYARDLLTKLCSMANAGPDEVSKRVSQLMGIIAYGLPALVGYMFVTRPLRFALGIAALLVSSMLWDTKHDALALHQERSFFGVLKVDKARHSPIYSLMHGTTLHGKQIRDEEHRHEPQTYYHPTGPIGQVFAGLPPATRKDQIALIGLGSGTLACYGEPGQRLTIYDIDPAVVRIAKNPEYFTYLADSKADIKIVLGDARLRLTEAENESYGLIVVDAFSSDAIPLHLITREAIQLYFEKLKPHGVLAVHISNRYLDLKPVLANIADNLGIIALDQSEPLYSQEIDRAVYPAKERSEWVVLARSGDDLGAIILDERWLQIRTDPKVGVWTDDYSNLLGVFNW